MTRSNSTKPPADQRMLRLNAADPALGPTVSHSSLVAEAIQNRRNRAVGTGLSQLPYQLSPGGYNSRRFTESSLHLNNSFGWVSMVVVRRQFADDSGVILSPAFV